MAKQNRFASANRHVTIRGRKILISPRLGLRDLPAEVLKDLIAEEGEEDKICDRIWKNWQEQGGEDGRWTLIRAKRTNPDDSSTSYEMKRVRVTIPNPFEKIQEPHLRAALKQRGYL